VTETRAALEVALLIHNTTGSAGDSQSGCAGLPAGEEITMKTVGIIAEYNPFHQGHAFHLSSARKLSQADYVIVAMSGNYVQRGVPAMFDKYTRTQAALQNGADLVLELPLCAATGSAEYFASGAVSLLTRTGILTDLCFGSECGDLSLLEPPARILAEEPDDYRELLRQHLKAGKPFPKARALALCQYDPSIPEELLNEPNNLLAVEYLKALYRQKSTVRIHTVRRTGNQYHETTLTHGQTASASALRQFLIRNNGTWEEAFQTQLPSFELYRSYEGKPPVTEDSFSLLLLEKLRRLQDTSLTSFFDVTEELSNRIWNCLDDFSSFSQFTDLIKTRNMTRTAVSRALLHILLDIRSYQEPAAFRVLGFRRNADILLKELSGQGSLPLITGLSGADMPSEALYADRLYESVRSLLHGQPYQNEYRRKLLVL
ncbi:MAG: nucleotidyltransferase family protein, partial [Clostridiales bacterium]|nr:nucleotidyltransferase family protein [Clostridiales bacterium]